MSENNLPPARILGIETSCDETAAAVVENGRIILSSVIASQAGIHAKYGGVFPEVASREHIRMMYPVIEEALQQAHMELKDIDAVAVTRGPGLPGSLVVGMNMAKGLALGSGKPLIGINHLEAHLYSAWMVSNEDGDEPMPELVFPILALIVSGGHSELILMKGHQEYQRLGGTLDDAAGEAFDKVARMLGLGYPGGPAIDEAAQGGNDTAYKFPRAWLRDSWDFSFSGLKTAVLHVVRDLQDKGGGEDTPLPVKDLAASFQAAVVDVLVTKTRFAAQEFDARELLVVGGVSANRLLRELITRRAPGKVYIPPIELCTDNAAMVAAVAYRRHIRDQNDPMDMDALPTWPISEL
jgi:N6-L-threonylcarbamoyladenine synthase